MDRNGMTALSEAFRGYFDSVSEFARLQIEKLMQVTFNVKNLRNVQLWTRRGAQTRNFVNPTLGALEIDMRIAFAQGVIEQRIPTFPVKLKEFDGYLEANGQKLREYLQSDYVRLAVSRILFNPEGECALEYDAYGNGYPEDPPDEDDLEEFME